MSDQDSPGSLLQPEGRCFHCGADLPGDAAVCSGCGGARTLSATEERGAIAYLLQALQVAVRERKLNPGQAEGIAARYRSHAGWEPPPSAAPAPTPRPPRKPLNPTVLWANGLVSLGAFFVLITAALFLLSLGGLGRTILTALGAVSFLVAGFACRRFEIVRTAGNVFVGTAALLLPFIFVALASYLEGRGPMALRFLWLAASLACVFAYASMTLGGLGRFYAVLTALAISNAFLALHHAAQWLEEWYAPLFAAQALFLVTIHATGGGWLQRRFGWILLGWGWLWALAALAGWCVVSAWGVTGAGLITLACLIAAGWLTHLRHPNPVSPPFAAALQLVFAAQVVRYCDGPWWGVGMVLAAASVIYVVVGRLGRGWSGARSFLPLGVLAAVIAAQPNFYAAGPGLWHGALAGFLATASLVAAALLSRSWILLAAGWTVGSGWFFLVSLIPNDNPTVADLGLAFLPLVVLLAAVSLLLKTGWVRWRWTIVIITVAHLAHAIILTVGESGPASVALLVATAVGVAFTARWREPWLPAFPAATSFGLVLTNLDWMGAPRPSFGPSALTLGLALWSLGLAVRSRFSLVLRVSGAVVAVAAFAVGCLAQFTYEGTGTNWSAHLGTLTLFALALWIAWESWERRPLLYLASFVALASGLWELAAFEVENLQAYAVPLGLYFMVAGFVAGRRGRQGTLADLLVTSAWILSAIAFCLPTLLQTMGQSPMLYASLLLAESVFLVVLGLIVKRYGMMASASGFAILAGLRMVFLNPILTLPALVLASITFFAVGLGVLVYQGRKRARVSGA